VRTSPRWSRRCLHPGSRSSVRRVVSIGATFPRLRDRNLEQIYPNKDKLMSLPLLYLQGFVNAVVFYRKCSKIVLQ
jgi:hypothetical protein